MQGLETTKYNFLTEHKELVMGKTAERRSTRANKLSCVEKIKPLDIRVRDPCHSTGKNTAAAHQSFSLKNEQCETSTVTVSFKNSVKKIHTTVKTLKSDRYK